MSQPSSSSGFSVDTDKPTDHPIQKEQNGSGVQQNGRSSAEILSENKVSNGFDARNRPQQPTPKEEAESDVKGQTEMHPQQQYVEERPPSVPLLVAHQPYPENIVLDRVQLVAQGGIQPVPVLPTQLGHEYLISASGDPIPYSQIHGTVYNPGQNPGYVSRDSGYRDQTYPQNLAMPAGPGSYVGQPPQTQQPIGPPPAYYPNKAMGLPPPGPAGYVHYAPQVHYGQYPQAIVNPGPAPFTGQKNIYPQQMSQQPAPAQHSPNPPRYSQDQAQFQGQQPIIQPIAQNVSNAERTPRGPKPMVPPRINSKITSDTGQRKSISMDQQTAQKPKTDNDGTIEGQVTQESQSQPGQPGQNNASTKATPRTRADGLYVAANGELCKEQANTASAPVNPETAIYVSRSEHKVSGPIDINNGSQRRSEALPFPCSVDTATQQSHMVAAARNQLNNMSVVDNRPVEINVPSYPVEQKRIDINATMRMSPMPVLPPMSIAPKNTLVSGERKSVEWSSLSPNQRAMVPQENRRSDYFEDHRRSPMTVEGRRMEEIRRSPMAFIPIRDTNAPERLNQRSPNNMGAQNFEKTRAELAMWAEQRQRQESENRILYTTTPRSRNPSEDRNPSRPDSRGSFVHPDKEVRLSVAPSAFQPISQNSIVEQRRHLRHVSADLTKHMDFVRKDFDDQLMTGSVVNLGTTSASAPMGSVLSRASPNMCYQYPSLSEAKLDVKMPLTIVTDFSELPSKPLEQSDHIIHSHRKSKSHGVNNQTGDKSHNNSHNPSNHINNKADSQQPIPFDQQSIDFITEKLSQCERQQSDLHAKLQSLQNQNEILDKVALFQYAHSDFQSRMQNLHLQNQIAEKLNQKQIESLSEQEQTNQSILNQCINASRQLYGQSLLPTPNPGYVTKERISPRLHHQHQAHANSGANDHIPNFSQMPLPYLTPFDRSDVSTRGSYNQLQRVKSSSDNLDSIPCSQMSLSSLGSMTGMMKKVPPEKPPRTSLIAQSPDTESNRSQPAIGLKHTSKARLETKPGEQRCSKNVERAESKRRGEGEDGLAEVKKLFCSTLAE
ncbi:hypothetical protein QAD02_012045 [Eretmocerus hayati]|uniref:Uncharacterized protein n=1 Tax=Eretmocerus hayati TaxID=131215 RepID=A0ACC2NYX0_9HYME|nr:hypothetical protein QAD02_012045 [Eretmocerus hayati]